VQDIRKVVAWMAGALLSFSALAVSIRSLTGAGAGLTVFEVLALRNLGGLVLLGGFAVVRRDARIGAPSPLRIHVVRNLFHFVGQACWTFGLTVLPLATVFALEFTTPAWTMLLAFVFLHERVTRARIGAVVLGFIGVLIILRPGIGTFQPAALVVLVAAVGFAVQLTTTKFLTGHNTVLTIMFWMNMMQLPMYLAASAATGGSVLILPKLSMAVAPAVIGLCASGLMAHVCVTNAFRHGEAILVVPIDFLRIPVIATVGALLYAEPFDPFVLLGAGVTATGIVWNLVDSRRRA